MRKNIYDNRIIMVSNSDIVGLFSHSELVNSEQVVNRLNKYKGLILQVLSENGKKQFIDGSREFGILINDETDKQLMNAFYELSLKYDYVDLESIKNAYICALTNGCDPLIREALENALINRASSIRGDFAVQYGEEVLDYVMASRMYSYEYDINPLVESDKNIMLCYNELIEKVTVSKEKNYLKLDK